jgi:hypothetical protein
MFESAADNSINLVDVAERETQHLIISRGIRSESTISLWLHNNQTKAGFLGGRRENRNSSNEP